MSKAIMKTDLNTLCHSAVECSNPTLMNEMVDRVIDEAMENQEYVKELVRDGIKKRIGQFIHNPQYASVKFKGHVVKRYLSIEMSGLTERQYIDVTTCAISQFRVAMKQRDKANSKRQKNYRKEQKALEAVSAAIPPRASASDRVSDYVKFS